MDDTDYVREIRVTVQNNFPNFAQLHGKILRNRTYVRKKHISR